MSSNASLLINETQNEASERKKNTTWMLSLYGTAIGAGTLFLPIDAGLNGIIPLLIIAFLAFPMTYYSHKALCRVVISSRSEQHDITDVVDEYFGEKAGNILTYMYFFSIYPILLMYCVAITNTVISFMTHQLHWGTFPRSIVSLILITALMIVIRKGQNSVIKAMSVLVYPFVFTLMALSLYLIPHWSGSVFESQNLHLSPQSLLFSLWLLIPVVIFSFNHSPIISSFAVDQKKRFGEDACEKSAGILKHTHALMVFTVMFFVFSCVLSLSPAELSEAKSQNISILSYLANHFDTPLIAYVAPFIAFIAIAKSYLGHYLGASEGLKGIVSKKLKRKGKSISDKKLDWVIDAFIMLSCWVTATLNPNILTIIETLGGPIIAIFLFLMPMYAIATVPSMKKYQRPLANSFTAFMGIIALSAILYGIKHSLMG